jgi:hypothetical protein
MTRRREELKALKPPFVSATETRNRVRQRVQRWRLRYPEKYKASQDVKLALKSGVVKRPGNCSQCQKECKPEGHHEDYSKPLEVVWLCKSCHESIPTKHKPKGSK